MYDRVLQNINYGYGAYLGKHNVNLRNDPNLINPTSTLSDALPTENQSGEYISPIPGIIVLAAVYICHQIICLYLEHGWFYHNVATPYISR